MRTVIVAAATLFLANTAALAQSPAAPYAGMQTRAIKALSDTQIADLKAGRGMGLALPAELNGYPGPSHLIELADRLGLTGEQRARFEAMFAAMKAETVPLGERLIAQETALDGSFAAGTVNADTLKTATAKIAQTQGELRNAHLRYHLATAELLSAEQLRNYRALRGYGGGHHSGHRPH